MSYSEDGREYSARGFRIFGARERLEHERLYGNSGEVTVVESSIAGRGAHVRIYAPGDEQVQLNWHEAFVVREALDAFIMEARAGELTEGIDA